ncbi:MAG: hypothetical protein H6684_02965 [Deltaproteobacteria bacterium]|nr:hypothetical protein [Deltaproteobacteria bacterium]MCB9487675.1 hypothetical protein [Deltaproteobacteria bacterium]
MTQSSPASENEREPWSRDSMGLGVLVSLQLGLFFFFNIRVVPGLIPTFDDMGGVLPDLLESDLSIWKFNNFFTVFHIPIGWMAWAYLLLRPSFRYLHEKRKDSSRIISLFVVAIALSLLFAYVLFAYRSPFYYACTILTAEVYLPSVINNLFAKISTIIFLIVLLSYMRSQSLKGIVVGRVLLASILGFHFLVTSLLYYPKVNGTPLIAGTSGCQPIVYWASLWPAGVDHLVGNSLELFSHSYSYRFVANCHQAPRCAEYLEHTKSLLWIRHTQ